MKKKSALYEIAKKLTEERGIRMEATHKTCGNVLVPVGGCFQLPQYGERGQRYRLTTFCATCRKIVVLTLPVEFE